MTSKNASDLVKSSEAARWWNTERPLTHPSDATRGGLAMDATRTCSRPDCEQSHYAKGWCQRHYRQRWEAKQPKRTKMARPTETDRFWIRVDKTPYCWLWTGRLCPAGYGRFDFTGGQLAHRFSYTLAFGPIPDGLTVDHKCFNPRCVNPDHLRLMTLSGNARNQRSASATHCKRGHEFTPENTRMSRRRKEYSEGFHTVRRCIACAHMAEKKSRDKARAQKSLKAGQP